MFQAVGATSDPAAIVALETRNRPTDRKGRRTDGPALAAGVRFSQIRLFSGFYEAVMRHYNDELPYHNSTHAVDILHAAPRWGAHCRWVGPHNMVNYATRRCFITAPERGGVQNAGRLCPNSLEIAPQWPVLSPLRTSASFSPWTASRFRAPRLPSAATAPSRCFRGARDRRRGLRLKSRRSKDFGRFWRIDDAALGDTVGGSGRPQWVPGLFRTAS